MKMGQVINITSQRRTRVNKISLIRKYISGRVKQFSRLNMQTANINGVKVRGSIRDIRTLKKHLNKPI